MWTINSFPILMGFQISRNFRLAAFIILFVLLCFYCYYYYYYICFIVFLPVLLSLLCCYVRNACFYNLVILSEIVLYLTSQFVLFIACSETSPSAVFIFLNHLVFNFMFVCVCVRTNKTFSTFLLTNTIVVLS